MSAWAALCDTSGESSRVGLRKTKKPPKEAVVKPEVESEASQQMKLVTWARGRGLLIFAIPNSGKRTPWQGERERSLGLLAGISDLFLSMPNKTYHGFYIEMKKKGQKPTILQSEWLYKVRQQGYRGEWFDDWQLAKNAIEEYLCGE